MGIFNIVFLTCYHQTVALVSAQEVHIFFFMTELLFSPVNNTTYG